MGYGIISTPMKLIIGTTLGLVVLVIVCQLLLVLYDYSVERLYMNQNMQILKNEMQEKGGLINYNINGLCYNGQNGVTDIKDNLGGKGQSLSNLYSQKFVHKDTIGVPVLYLDDPTNEYKFSNDRQKSDVSVDAGGPHFFTRSKYSLEVDFNSVRYVGSEVQVVLHRDLAFNMLWGKPWIIHLKEEASYVHDTQYTPSQGISREAGSAYVQ